MGYNFLKKKLLLSTTFNFLFFLKDLLHTCTRIMINDTNTPIGDPATTSSMPEHPTPSSSGGGKSTVTEALKSPSSSGFNTAVIKLAAKLLYVRNEQFSLETNMLGYLQDSDSTKVERFLIHWLLPLCIRMGTGRYGTLYS